MGQNLQKTIRHCAFFLMVERGYAIICFLFYSECLPVSQTIGPLNSTDVVGPCLINYFISQLLESICVLSRHIINV